MMLGKKAFVVVAVWIDVVHWVEVREQFLTRRHCDVKTPQTPNFAGHVIVCQTLHLALFILQVSLKQIQPYTWRIAYVDLRKTVWTQNSHADRACWGKLELTLAQTRWLSPVQVPCVTTSQTSYTSLFFIIIILPYILIERRSFFFLTILCSLLTLASLISRTKLISFFIATKSLR